MESLLNNSQPLPAQAFREILATAPRNLENLQAELLFVDGTYILHYREKEREVYKCLSADSLRRAFNNQPIDSGWLPVSVVRHGSNRIGDWSILVIPSARYTLNFEAEPISLTLPLPTLIFMGFNRDYWLWATKKNTFDPNAEVFQAPLPNVNLEELGKICWGQNQPPSANLHQIQKAWLLFITSQFSNHYVNHKSRQFKQNIIQKFTQLAEKAATSNRCRYPISDLVPIGKKGETIQQIVEVILESYCQKQSTR